MGARLCAGLVLAQSDLKALIAYSRIVHIGAIIGVLLISSRPGLAGSILISLAHGVVRAGLFYAVTLQYSRLANRSIIRASGLIVLMPNLSIF